MVDCSFIWVAGVVLSSASQLYPVGTFGSPLSVIVLVATHTPESANVPPIAPPATEPTAHVPPAPVAVGFVPWATMACTPTLFFMLIGVGKLGSMTMLLTAGFCALPELPAGAVAMLMGPPFPVPVPLPPAIVSAAAAVFGVENTYVSNEPPALATLVFAFCESRMQTFPCAGMLGYNAATVVVATMPVGFVWSVTT